MAGRIFVVFGNKGGTGKSVIAAHLAAFLQRKGPVALVDLDARQGDSLAFAEGRENPIPCFVPHTPDELRTVIDQVMAAGADLVVDCPPADSEIAMAAAALAHALVMPFRAGANDARALGRAIRIANQSQSPNGVPALLAVVNFLQRTNDGKAITALLKNSGVFKFMGTIGQRVQVNDAIGSHMATWEMDETSQAGQEALAVCQAIDRSVK